MPAGRYIVFEGVLGTGKTTQSKMFKAYLEHRFAHREIVWTREPGGSEIADAIRTVVQATPFQETMDPICEAYLFAASRAHTLRTVIKPALERGAIVIADRSFLSSVAFQGAGRDIGIDTVLRINDVAVNDFLPDAILYLDIDPATGLARTSDAKGDKFESLPVAFSERCREGYLGLATHDRFRTRWQTIDASGSREDVFARILLSGVIEKITADVVVPTLL